MDARDDAAFAALARDYRAWAVEGFLDQPLAGGFAVTAEGAWLKRKDDYADAETSDRRLRGWYAQTGILLPALAGAGRGLLALRHERMDSERATTTTRRNTTLGLSWLLKGHDRKLQADYTWKREIPAIANDELRVSLVGVF